MKKNTFSCYWLMACIILFSFVSGCVSVPNSPNPRFYSLHAQDKEKIKKFDTKVNTIIGVGPVRIPEYLNRPQIIVKKKDKTIVFDEFNRWAESLDFSLERMLNENLVLMLPGTSFQIFPWDFAIAVKYQVVIDIVELENNFNDNLFLAVQWSIIDLEKKRAVVTRRSEFSKDIYPHNYYGMVEALSETVSSLSTQVAEELVSIKKD
ncbi:MAG: PqiC family protein [Candidatus Omnitrophota bacterium]